VKRYLLDTCAISDARFPDTYPGLVDWFSRADTGSLYLSVATLSEVYSGIESLPHGKWRLAFEGWYGDVLAPAYAGRILAADEDLIPTWGRIRARARGTGNNADEIDLLIAATAVHHDLILVTRNERHFTGTGAAIENPW
jgi:predicted nucleic acid-binding protein